MEGPVSLSESQKCKRRKKNNTPSETAHPTPPRHRGGVLNTSACPSFPSLPCSSSKPWVSTNLAPAHLLPARPSHGSVLLAKNHPTRTHCARTRACQCHLHTRCSLPVTGSVAAPCACSALSGTEGISPKAESWPLLSSWCRWQNASPLVLPPPGIQ